MSHRVPRAPRVVPMSLAALPVGVILLSYGVAPASPQPGRLEGEVDSRIVPAKTGPRDPLAGEERSEELKIGISLRAAYDDNIFLSPDAKGDFVVKISPAVAWRKGDGMTGDGGYVRVAYKPTAVAYSDYDSNNRLDHVASWGAGWQGGGLKLAYESEGRALGDATADTGTLTDRKEWVHRGQVSWALRERLAVEIGGGHETTTYRDRRFADSSMTYGEVALRYEYSPKTALRAAYQAGTFEVEGAGEQTVQRATVRLDWKPREKIAIDIEAGAEHRSFDTGSSTSPVVEARVGWRPAEGTEIYLNGYRRERASAFLAGQNYTQQGVALGIVQKLNDKLSARVEGGVENAEYSRVSGAGPASREDNIHFIRPSLEYQFTDDFSMGLFYRYSRNSSNSAVFGYENHSAGLEVGYTF